MFQTFPNHQPATIGSPKKSRRPGRAAAAPAKSAADPKTWPKTSLASLGGCGAG